MITVKFISSISRGKVWQEMHEKKDKKADKMFLLQLPLVSRLQSIQKPTSLHSFAACSSEEQTPFLQESNWQFFFLMFRFTCLLQLEKSLGTQDRIDGVVHS